MAIAGIVYILIPECSRTRLAAAHFWGHNIGLPVMTLSLALYAYGVKAAEKTIAVGSVVVLVSLMLFAVNLFISGRQEQES
jgi:hypothetical protein